MSVPFWPDSLPVSYVVDFEQTPQDSRAMFDVEVGEPISRPRTTGVIQRINPTWRLTGAQAETFRTFYERTTGQGALKFIMRDALRDAPQWWKFAAPYRMIHLTKQRARVSAEILVMPHVPWFADYVRQGRSTVPAFVADYEGGVYGIDGTRTTVSQLPTIAGTYLVSRTVSGVTTTQEETLVAGDITETAPLNTTLIVGFEV
ncbi:hypothetical protein [Citreimonas sp.]|uniref:hypothetical protein n=1 Tax=Citreimonas sp. TaxID=3036715 RepID=UPI00405A1A03